jgi:hypothetical protein
MLPVARFHAACCTLALAGVTHLKTHKPTLCGAQHAPALTRWQQPDAPSARAEQAEAGAAEDTAHNFHIFTRTRVAAATPGPELGSRAPSRVVLLG